MNVLGYEIGVVYLNEGCWKPNWFKVPQKKSINISILGFFITIDKAIDK